MILPDIFSVLFYYINFLTFRNCCVILFARSEIVPRNNYFSMQRQIFVSTQRLYVIFFANNLLNFVIHITV